MIDRTWYFYDRASGLFNGAAFTGQAESMEQQLVHLGAGFGAFEGEVDYLSQRLDLETMSLVEHRPAPPWDGTDLTLFVWWWDHSTKRWRLRPRLKKLKADKWAEAKAARELAVDAPLVTVYGEFDHHEAARAAIASTAQACLATGEGVAFTLANNQVVQLAAAEMNEVWAASHARVQAARAEAEALRTAIDQAPTAEALAKITI